MVVPMDWRGACIVPLYKRKGDKCECSNSRGISLLSVVGKLFGGVLIKRVRAGTECAIGEEQCGFRQGRGFDMRIDMRKSIFVIFFPTIFGANSDATRETAATSPKVLPGSTISAVIYQISPAHLP